MPPVRFTPRTHETDATGACCGGTPSPKWSRGAVAVLLAIASAGCAAAVRDHGDARAVPAAFQPPSCLHEVQGDEELCQTLSELDGARRFQECVWLLRDNGREDAAAKYAAYIERELAEGDIESKEPIAGGFGMGTNENYLVTLRGGMKAVFKPEAPLHDAELELAVFRLDQLVGLDVVPITVLREIDGKKGSLQYFVRGTGTGWDDVFRAQGDRIAFLDALSANVDRHRGNWLFFYPDRVGKHAHTTDRRVAIDHDRTFEYGRPAPELPTGSSAEFMALEVSFREGLERATEEVLTRELGPLLSARQLQGLLQRRAEILRALCDEGC